MSPAEIGYLFDSRSGAKESISTILDLEQRGLIKIHKTSDNLFNVSRSNNQDNFLKPHEQLVMDSISALKNVDIENYTLFFGFNKQVRNSLKQGGFIDDKSNLFIYYIGKVFQIYFLFNVVILAWLIFQNNNEIVALLISSMLVFILGAPVIIGVSLVAAYIHTQVTGHGAILNTKSKNLWPEIEGYREYIKQVELDEIQFESEELKLRSKNKSLPYAVAFGLDTKWDKRVFN